jgi:hypothetical protein
MRKLLWAVLVLSGCYDWNALSEQFNSDGGGTSGDGGSTPADLAGVDLQGLPFMKERPGDNSPLNAVRGTSNASVVYAVGNGGRILRYGGGAWASVASGTTNLLRDVWILGTDVVVVGDGPTGIVDKGAGFMPEAPNLGRNALALFGTPEGGLIAVGDGGGGGKAWAKQATGWLEHDRTTGEDLYGLWGTAKSFIAVGTNSAALHITSDPGTSGFSSTKRDLLPAGRLFRAVWGSAAGDVWAVGDGGAISRWDGTAWTLIPPAGLPTSTLRGIWGSSASNIYAVGDTGTLLHYDGTRWSRAGTAPITNGNLNDIWGTADGSRFWIVTSLGEIFRSP